MNTIEAVAGMLAAMPEDARLRVLDYTRELFTTGCSENPHPQRLSAQMLSDLAESRSQIAGGEGLDMEKALEDLGDRHGFK